MSSARSTSAWAPQGMPAATARAAGDRRSAASTALVFLAFGAGFAVLRGARPETFRSLLPLALFIAAVAAFMALKAARTEILAGPGWIATREIVRRRWVRSDQLSSVKVHRSGLTYVLTLRDRDGRKVGLVPSDLDMDPTVRRRLAADVRTSARDGADIAPVARELLLGGS
jgi:hypothetical protein